MAIANIVIGATETTIIQSGASENRAVTGIVFFNADTATRLLTIYAYPTGGSATDETTLAKQISIPSLDSYVWETGDMKFILGASDKISAIADVGAKITATPSWLVI
jgi:H2-forming N5,N10-methylenetetrahydromethanopterin dehydrogenase-like enzyme